MYFRKGRRPIVSLDQLMEEIGFEPIDPQTLDAERVEAERKLQEYDEFLAIRSRILELPIKYQEVIMLRYFERKGMKETAEILNKKEGTVKSCSHVASENSRICCELQRFGQDCIITARMKDPIWT